MNQPTSSQNERDIEITTRHCKLIMIYNILILRIIIDRSLYSYNLLQGKDASLVLFPRLSFRLALASSGPCKVHDIYHIQRMYRVLVLLFVILLCSVFFSFCLYPRKQKVCTRDERSGLLDDNVGTMSHIHKDTCRPTSADVHSSFSVNPLTSRASPQTVERGVLLHRNITCFSKQSKVCHSSFHQALFTQAAKKYFFHHVIDQNRSKSHSKVI